MMNHEAAQVASVAPAGHQDHGQDQSNQPAAPRHAFVVVNPVAGCCLPDEVRRVLGAAFDERGWRYDFHETTGSDDFAALVDEARREGADIVVAAGGDGTVADVADALVGTGLPLAIVPLGTGNVLSLDLGIPQDLRLAAALLVGPHRICQLDAMRLGGRHYFLQIGAGIDSLMIRDTDRQNKRRFGRAAYMATLFRQLGSYNAKRFRVEVDGEPFRVRAWDVLIANAGTVGIPIFRWGRDISPADGHLDLVVLKVRGPIDYLRTLWYLLLGLPRSGPPVTVYPILREATIATKRPLPVQADGEIVGRTPVTVSVVPRAVAVVVPPSAAAAPAPTERREAEARERAWWLQRRLRRWLGPIGLADTTAALVVNSLPRSPLFDLIMRMLALVMNRGDGWVAWLVGAVLASGAPGWRALLDVAPALWLTDFTVEFPLKSVFRRDRPFQARVLTPVVGRKPGSHSFPSGHSAAAFAGAWLLGRHFPRWLPAFYSLAALVCFSRLYLGVHYLSDVATGAVSGVLLAAGYRAVIRGLGKLISGSS